MMTSVKEWSCDRVAEWLIESGLDMLVDRFRGWTFYIYLHMNAGVM